MKFADCIDCKFLGTHRICAECDMGEQFEERQAVPDLCFDTNPDDDDLKLDFDTEEDFDNE
jgi:hypothetical protein